MGRKRGPRPLKVITTTTVTTTCFQPQHTGAQPAPRVFRSKRTVIRRVSPQEQNHRILLGETAKIRRARLKRQRQKATRRARREVIMKAEDSRHGQWGAAESEQYRAMREQAASPSVKPEYQHILMSSDLSWGFGIKGAAARLANWSGQIKLEPE